MKLPDFTSSEIYNRLRSLMGAELGVFSGVEGGYRLSEEEIERLARTGIEVPVEKVQIFEDVTLGYKNSRVILYIREAHLQPEFMSFSGGRLAPEQIPPEPEEEKLPRYHVALCSTLDKMRSLGRSYRYVVATREDGIFELVLQGRKLERRLRVCKNCLSVLNWNGYSGLVDPVAKERTVREFSIREFYAKYGRGSSIAVRSLRA